MFLELIKGVSLLLALCYLQGFNHRLWRQFPLVSDLASGLLFGGICAVGMLMPLEVAPGIIFDARSVILCMAGLFGGPIVATVAGLIAGGYRIWLGGGGVYVGTAVIVACVLLGLAYRHARQRGWIGVGGLALLGFGLLVHIVVVLLFTQLPAPAVDRVMGEIALPFVVTFTLATGLLGLLLRDIENRHKTEEALRDSETRLTLHLQNTPIAAITWDREFRTIQWNRAAEDIFGYTAAEALGRRATELIIPAGIEADLDALFATLLAERGGVRNTNENRTKDGRTILCEWYNTPIRDRCGVVTGVASLALDVTDRQRTQRDLQRALIAAEKANQAKSDFLARLSHEFRTPLNAIIGFSEVLQMKLFGPLGDRRYDEYAIGIHESGVHLLDLINDVLDISAIEAGKRPLVKEPIDIAATVGESIDIVRPSAERRRISLVTDMPGDLPAIPADRRAVKQILLNLLSNAVKFSGPEALVTTTARLSGDALVLTVADTGIGIEPDVLPTVTDLFARGASNAHLAREGTGLGLAIVKSLVEAHGGRLEIDSEIGKGTSVRVTLPLRDGEAGTVV